MSEYSDFEFMTKSEMLSALLLRLSLLYFPPAGGVATDEYLSEQREHVRVTYLGIRRELDRRARLRER